MPIEEISVEEETKIENIADNLYSRIAEETDKILRNQIRLLGGDPDREGIATNHRLKKVFYPVDDKALATYKYKGKVILGVRIGESRMGIEFDIADPLTMARYEGEIEVEETEDVPEEIIAACAEQMGGELDKYFGHPKPEFKDSQCGEISHKAHGNLAKKCRDIGEAAIANGAGVTAFGRKDSQGGTE